MQIHPVRRLQGEIEIPGDKSVSHRYAILGAMAEGRTRISNFSSSVDCSSTLGCLESLGVSVHRDGAVVIVESGGWMSFRRPGSPLDAGNSGTTIRLVSALLSCRPMTSSIGGDDSLNGRPMKRIIVPLSSMGARIEAREQQFPPLVITGTELVGTRFRLPVASAQVKSCVLLAGLTASGRTTVVEEVPTRDHTERALPHFGASLEKRGIELTVTGRQQLVGTEMRIPGDFSSAVFFILAALLVPDADLVLKGVGVNPSRTGFLDLLVQAGARIEQSSQRTDNGEPVADLRVRYSSSVFEGFPAEIGGARIPNLIDEIPALAILAARSGKGTRVSGAQELRKKESDRIRSVVENLRALDVEVEEFEDGFRVIPTPRLRGGRIRTFGDHRIAMAFAVAGLVAEDPVELDRPECAAVSFPEFFDHLKNVTS